MILSFHPDRHSPKENESGPKFIGYWHSVRIDPQSLEILGPACGFDRYEEKFGECSLPIPSDYVDPTWDTQECAKIIVHLKNGQEWEAWRGYSFCRFGCKIQNGSHDLTDGTYVWPEGFAHYVEVHNVKPPQQFIDHVLKGK